VEALERLVHLDHRVLLVPPDPRDPRVIAVCLALQDSLVWPAVRDFLEVQEQRDRQVQPDLQALRDSQDLLEPRAGQGLLAHPVRLAFRELPESLDQLDPQDCRD